MKKTLKGVTTPSGDLSWWTGIPVGAALPWVIGKTWASSVVTGWMTSSGMRNDPDQATQAMVSDLHMANVVAMLSPLVVALPFLLFKKTRGAALGIILGGVVSDAVYVLVPAKSSGSSTSTSSTSTSTTEGALGRSGVQILR